jgi:hypothetical protein
MVDHGGQTRLRWSGYLAEPVGRSDLAQADELLEPLEIGELRHRPLVNLELRPACSALKAIPEPHSAQ